MSPAVTVGLPVKQGLKHSDLENLVTYKASNSRTSSKTRIETG